jgi:D-3-phosphoglycerate dehydrogenase / 2-oxoglutarate reductase
MKYSLNKEKIKILLLEGVHSKAIHSFNDHGYSNIETLKSSLPFDQLIKQLEDVHILGIRSRTQVTEEVIKAAKRLISVGCFCIGTNQVALEATASMGIPVFNAPHSNTRSVAELVIGLTVVLFRNIFEKSMAAHQGQWLKSAEGSHEVRGKVMGIVGYGHIGSQVSILAEAIGMHVLYYDIQTKLPLGNAHSTNSLSELLKKSDIVTLHVPEDTTTKDMIGYPELKIMKKGSFLINASRGHVVVIKALKEALEAKQLKGAAIDVFPKEPKSGEEEFTSILRDIPNVILTPHIGGSTKEAQENIALEVSRSLIDFSDKGFTEGAVNFPQVNLPLHPGSHRILHIHHNVPGILQQINTIIGKEEINVLGQHLQTTNTIGYVLLDIAKESSKRLLEQLNTIQGTIRSRLLF